MPKLIPFVWSTDAVYELCFGAGYIRLLRRLL
jgi:hypothetical protein